MVPKTMKTAALFAAALVEIEFKKEPLVEETGVITGREMLTKNAAGPLGSFVFVVRRPG